MVAPPRGSSPSANAGNARELSPGKRRSPFAWGLAAGLLIVLVLAAATLRNGSEPADGERPLRIAVMPFEPAGPTSVLEPGNDIAESIVELLVASEPQPDVIGPTTTARFADPPRLRELFAELDVDYLVNARETTGDGGPRLLVEIIRATDGAHLWAQYLDEFPDGSTPARTIARAVGQLLLEGDTG